MTPDTHISFRNLDPSPAMTARIEAEIRKLGRFCPDILSCRVVVETLHRHHRSGHHYQLHVTLKIPGAEIVVSHEPDSRSTLAGADAASSAKRLEVDGSHREPYVVIRDAFDVARRRLADELRRTRARRRPETAAMLLT